MKQLLLSLALLTVSLNTTAQIKNFTLRKVPGYEILECDRFTITKDINGKLNAFLKAENDVFSYEHPAIIIEILAANDSLILKTDWECHTSDDCKCVYLYNGSKLSTHLEKHISNPELCDCLQTNFPLSHLWTMITEAPGYIRFFSLTLTGLIDFKAYTIPLYDYIMQKE